MNTQASEAERELAHTDVTVLQAISKAELDQQITTARAYPRSLRRFVEECMDMATLNERIAGECIYALPRDGKTIEGPSARLAEIVASAWGNCRAGARVVDEGPEFITAQGIFHDLERNVAITYEVRRRITDKHGKRYKADMVGVTGNAACSIALRNAVFKGVPKAFWSDIYDAARKAAVGDVKTIANRRADALARLQKMGATQDQVLAVLNVKGVEDIGTEELATLFGIATAIKDGDTTVEEAFAVRAPSAKAGTAAPKASAAEPVVNGKTPKQKAPGVFEALRAKLEQFGLPESSLLARFEIGKLEELPFDSVNAAYDWIPQAARDL